VFKKVLVANRGEIAVRVIRALKELGIQSVAVYSKADEEALHTKLADEAYLIGEPPAIKSYLNLDAILQAAKEANAEAIHPGYGFLPRMPTTSNASKKPGSFLSAQAPQLPARWAIRS